MGPPFSILSASKRDLLALKPQQKQKRNRLIALIFASVLLLLVYGPLAQWFVAADRMLYDQLATHLPNKPLDNAVIISLDASKYKDEDIVATYGKVVEALSLAGVKRIIMTEPPELGSAENLPGWSVAMTTSPRNSRTVLFRRVGMKRSRDPLHPRMIGEPTLTTIGAPRAGSRSIGISTISTMILHRRSSRH